ncbi:MAG: NAD(P)-dependent alcohol dehydrogenase [Novosphingobium sp.]|jgi:NADPH:quinone reductase-like Zn-dependent oxidoreductase|nr:NAD(P)-dependent alcohol dehydrogenase [Novosphingobium sp.]
MKQATVQSGKGIGTLAVKDVAVPRPGSGEALVRLHAATLNFRDLIIAKGLMPGLGKEPEVIPLSCGAGVVESIGSGVTHVQPGNRVSPIFALGWLDGPTPTMEMLGGPVDGVARQYAVFPAESLVHNPDQLGDLEAATLTCAGLTSWSALTRHRPTRPGDWVLAHGTGGVSLAALQFAKGMGAHVAITSSSDAKLARARSLGADLTVNYRTTPNWAEAIRKALGGSKIANVIDTVGGTQFDDNASLLAEDGQISAIGMLGSQFSWMKGETGVNMVPISVGNRAQHEAMLAFIVEHDIKPPVDVVFDLDRIQDAYHALEAGRFFGKVGINLL